ncbi:hydroxyacylglutathione hydrolase [Legionella hackeliae]|uniref:Hydroxyacylglutathione hydrolase n=1 Tax=Legionella hackeliae TaxID=449 RepID=A0A0A8UV30_LEGHA|nr:hydroxyacylglutathione hydrolase [Legionella hackeliae]KTD09718.1 hydroxyacylglutathione hydrolase (glyoxalase II) [Legionella hackeliae]CEK10957.1 putative hydroxyacylglutathione hydrolase [Legionella hackeliae]STX47695.1 hydroxyacylglutathione hydrolase [Legionella hackeliae]
MKVQPVAAFNDNYIWMIIDERKAAALCVDPGDAQPVINFLTSQSLQLQAILLTHHHHDHIGGVLDLTQIYPDIPVYGPEDPRIPFVTHTLKPDTVLSLTPYNFKILGTPGHTSTHISLFEPTYQWLFCGDTLFSAGCGRVFDGTIEELFSSLQKIRALPEETKVFCAHEYTRQNLRFANLVEPSNLAVKDYSDELRKNDRCSLPSTIGLEKKINPFLRTDTQNFTDYAHQRANNSRDPFIIFKQLRADKNNFS